MSGREMAAALPGISINDQEVKREELHSKLMERLGRRVEWTVYFGA